MRKHRREPFNRCRRLVFAPMSLAGQKLPKWTVRVMSAFPLIATAERTLRAMARVGTKRTSQWRHCSIQSACLKRAANNGHRQRYCSITSSARVSGAPSAVWKDSRSLFLQKGRPAGLGTAWMGQTALAIFPIRH